MGRLAAKVASMGSTFARKPLKSTGGVKAPLVALAKVPEIKPLEPATIRFAG